MAISKFDKFSYFQTKSSNEGDDGSGKNTDASYYTSTLNPNWLSGHSDDAKRKWKVGSLKTTSDFSFIDVDKYFNFYNVVIPRVDIEFRVFGNGDKDDWINLKDILKVNNNNNNNNFFVSAVVEDNGFKTLNLELFDRTFTTLSGVIQAAIYYADKPKGKATEVSKNENVAIQPAKTASGIHNNIRFRFGYAENVDYEVGKEYWKKTFNWEDADINANEVYSNPAVYRWNSRSFNDINYVSSTTSADKVKEGNHDVTPDNVLTQNNNQSTVVNGFDEYYINNVQSTLTNTGINYTITAVSSSSAKLNGYKIIQKYGNITGKPEKILTTLMTQFNSGEFVKIIWYDSYTLQNLKRVYLSYGQYVSQSAKQEQDRINENQENYNVLVSKIEKTNLLLGFVTGGNSQDVKLLTMEKAAPKKNSDGSYDASGYSAGNITKIKNVWNDIKSQINPTSDSMGKQANGPNVRGSDSEKYLALMDLAQITDNYTSLSFDKKMYLAKYLKNNVINFNYDTFNQKLVTSEGYTYNTSIAYADFLTKENTWKSTILAFSDDFYTLDNYSEIEQKLNNHFALTSSKKMKIEALKQIFSAIEECPAVFCNSNGLKSVAIRFPKKLYNLFCGKGSAANIKHMYNGLMLTRKNGAGGAWKNYYPGGFYIKQEKETDPHFPGIASVAEPMNKPNKYLSAQKSLTHWTDQLLWAIYRIKSGDTVLSKFDKTISDLENLSFLGNINAPELDSNNIDGDNKNEITVYFCYLLGYLYHECPSVFDDTNYSYILLNALHTIGSDSTRCYGDLEKNYTGIEYNNLLPLAWNKDGNIIDISGAEVTDTEKKPISAINFKNNTNYIGSPATWKNRLDDLAFDVWYDNTLKPALENFSAAYDAVKEVYTNHGQEDDWGGLYAYQCLNNIVNELKENNEITVTRTAITNNNRFWNDSPQYLKEGDTCLDTPLTSSCINTAITSSSGYFQYLAEKNIDKGNLDCLKVSQELTFILNQMSSTEKDLAQKINDEKQNQLKDEISLSLGGEETAAKTLYKPLASILNDFCAQCPPFINYAAEAAKKNKILKGEERATTYTDEMGEEHELKEEGAITSYNLTWDIVGYYNGDVPIVGLHYKRPLKFSKIRKYCWGTGNPKKHCVKSVNISNGSEFTFMSSNCFATIDAAGRKVVRLTEDINYDDNSVINIYERKQTTYKEKLQAYEKALKESNENKDENKKTVLQGKLDTAKGELDAAKGELGTALKNFENSNNSKQLYELYKDYINVTPNVVQSVLSKNMQGRAANAAFQAINRGAITVLGDPSLNFGGRIQPFCYPIYLDISLQNEGQTWDSSGNGIKSVLSGYYVCSKFTHNISQSGYTTTIDVMRYPGIDEVIQS